MCDTVFVNICILTVKISHFADTIIRNVKTACLYKVHKVLW